MYAIVETVTEGNELEVSTVCSNWLTDYGNVVWPNNYNVALRKRKSPDNSWTHIYKCRILENNIPDLTKAKEREEFYIVNADPVSEEAAQNPEIDDMDSSATIKYELGDEDNSAPASLPAPLPEFTPVQLAGPSLCSDNPVLSMLRAMQSTIEEQNKSIKLLSEQIADANNEIKQLRVESAKNAKVLSTVTDKLFATNKELRIVIDPDFIGPPMPMATLAEIIFFNEQLSDHYFMEQMVIRLHKFKCPNVNKSTKLIFEHLFQYGLIRKYSWTGQAGINKEISKKVFNELHGIIQLVENTFNYQNTDALVTTEEVKCAIKAFLKRSSINCKKE